MISKPLPLPSSGRKIAYISRFNYASHYVYPPVRPLLPACILYLSSARLQGTSTMVEAVIKRVFREYLTGYREGRRPPRSAIQATRDLSRPKKNPPSPHYKRVEKLDRTRKAPHQVPRR